MSIQQNATQSQNRNWVRACGVSEVTPDLPKAVVAGETPVALVLHDGEYYAIHDVCSHSAVSLSEGEVDGCTVECWLHGSRFDLRTGRPLDPPATRPVPVYPVQIEDGSVYVQVAPRSGR